MQSFFHQPALNFIVIKVIKLTYTLQKETSLFIIITLSLNLQFSILIIGIATRFYLFSFLFLSILNISVYKFIKRMVGCSLPIFRCSTVDTSIPAAWTQGVTNFSVNLMKIDEVFMYCYLLMLSPLSVTF